MLRAGLEYGPVLAFLVAYLWLKDNTYTIAVTTMKPSYSVPPMV